MHRTHAGALLGGSWRTAAAMFLITTLTFYDVIIVKRVFDPHVAGLYAGATIVGRGVYSAVAFLPAIILPKVANRTLMGSPTRSLLLYGVAGTIIPFLLAIGLAAAYPHDVLSVVVGHSFVDASALLIPLLIAAMGLGLTNVLATYLIARKQFGFIIPLAIVFIAEVGTVVAYHPDTVTVAATIGIGHAAAALAVGIGAIVLEHDRTSQVVA